MNQLKIKEKLLVESCEDYVGIWTIIWELRQESLENDELLIREKTVEILRYFLERKLIDIGNFDRDGKFVVWDLQSNQVIERIESEWNQLGREPNIGDIAWFVATEKGEEIASTFGSETE